MSGLILALLILAEPPASPPGVVAPSPAQQAVRMTPTALLAWAGANERSSPALARDAYRALAGDRDVGIRSEARFRLAAMLAGEGAVREAALLLRQLLDEQPGAQRVRLELAGLQARLGDEEAARRTLRAVSAGPLPRDIARLVDRWSEALRARRPSGLSVELALSPDSNINRATTADRLSTSLGDFTIDPSAKGRAGLGILASASAFRRIGVGGRVDLVARVGGAARMGREPAFRQLDVDASLGAEARLGRNRLLIEGGAGQSWFGGAPFVRQLRATAALRRPLGPRGAIGMRLTGTAIDNRFDAMQDGRGALGELSFERALTTRSGLLLTAAGERFHARSPGHRTRRWEAGATGWQELGRLTLFGGVAAGGLRGDAPLPLLPEARRDRLTRLSLGMSVRSLSLFGLAPFARVIRERARSNIAFYDYARLRGETGFSRAF